MRKTTTRTHPLLRVLVGAVALTLTAGAAAGSPGYDDPTYAPGDEPAGYDTGYTYVRTLDGSATLMQGDTGDRETLEVNMPLLAGDRLLVAPESRVELLLADGGVLRVDGDSEVLLERLAGSPESGDRVTILRLYRGNLQLRVAELIQGEELPRVDTPNASVYLRELGVYRLTSAGADWTEVTVRRGLAEVATDGGNLEVRATEQAVVQGTAQPRTAVRTAGGYDSLELWGEDLDRRASEVTYVDESLRYAASPMADHGSWVEVSGSYAWRPRVADDWRPYWNGRWVSTPGGMNWVSNEPWGWVPYHYGTWDRTPGHGWVWYPGYRFSPAWVYWYWGPSHVAWVPVGYYTHHYRTHQARYGFRFGLYGWTGGSWSYYADWVFCPTGYFGNRYQHRYLYDGYGYHRRNRHDTLPRGILTTDTRGLGRGHWNRPQEAIDILRTRPHRRGGLSAGAGELPDVTPFVARGDELPAEVSRRVTVTDRGIERLAGTPMAPGLETRSPGRRTVVPRNAGTPAGDTADRRLERVTGVTRGRATDDAAGGRTGGVETASPRSVRPRVPIAEPGDRGGERSAGRSPRVETARPTAPAAPRGDSASPRSVRPRVPITEPGDRGGDRSTDRSTERNPRVETARPTAPAAPRGGGDSASPRSVRPRVPIARPTDRRDAGGDRGDSRTAGPGSRVESARPTAGARRTAPAAPQGGSADNDSLRRRWSIERPTAGSERAPVARPETRGGDSRFETLPRRYVPPTAATAPRSGSTGSRRGATAPRSVSPPARPSSPRSSAGPAPSARPPARPSRVAPRPDSRVAPTSPRSTAPPPSARRSAPAPSRPSARPSAPVRSRPSASTPSRSTPRRPAASSGSSSSRPRSSASSGSSSRSRSSARSGGSSSRRRARPSGGSGGGG